MLEREAENSPLGLLRNKDRTSGGLKEVVRFQVEMLTLLLILLLLRCHCLNVCQAFTVKFLKFFHVCPIQCSEIVVVVVW